MPRDMQPSTIEQLPGARLLPDWQIQMERSECKTSPQLLTDTRPLLTEYGCTCGGLHAGCGSVRASLCFYLVGHCAWSAAASREVVSQSWVSQSELGFNRRLATLHLDCHLQHLAGPASPSTAKVQRDAEATA